MNKRPKDNSLLFPLIAIIIGVSVSLINIYPVLFQDNVVQDDFRQSFFWVWRYWDPGLFKNCMFNDMYQSHLVRTPLLNLVFYLAHYFTDSLIFFSKISAIFVGTISTLFAYLFFYSLTKNRILAFIFTTFMAFVFWFTDHVPNGCTRSYLWAGLYAYLYFLNTNRKKLASFTCLFLLFLSPFTFLLTLGMEFYFLVTRSNYKQIISSIKSNVFNIFSLLFSALTAFLLYKVIFRHISTQGVGKTFTLEEMKTLPEFNALGRHPIFNASITDGSFFTNNHWGLPIGRIDSVLDFGFFIIFFGTIIIYIVFNKNKVFSILKSNTMLLFYSSISLYMIAKITFPMLFMPNRYIIVPSLLLSTLIPFVLFNELAKYLTYHKPQLVNLFYPVLAFLSLLTLYLARDLAAPNFVSMTPEIKKIVEKLPKDSVLAAHPKLHDLSMAPAITKKAVFIDYEHSVAFTKETLEEIRRRTRESFKIIYSSNKEELIKLIEINGITHLLVSEDFYKEDYLNNPWYSRPYNKFLRQIIKTNREKGFFLDKLLKESGKRYILVAKEEIKNHGKYKFIAQGI